MMCDCRIVGRPVGADMKNFEDVLEGRCGTEVYGAPDDYRYEIDETVEQE